MSLKLSNKASSSLGVYVDKFSREELGHVEASFTQSDVNKIVSRVISFYGRLKASKDYVGEIKEALKNQDFVRELHSYIINFLNNRPTQERVDYYRGLCEKYGHTPKVNMNKNKMEKRISKLIRTNGESQDI
ncbi:hypothetical protein ABE137_07245 [Brevibacillus laterosporus]|uniref:hypothetical protein n=1 Tax=Brevibacillus laterosporus TaxID=1465 RepID=UPI003D1D755F